MDIFVFYFFSLTLLLLLVGVAQRHEPLHRVWAQLRCHSPAPPGPVWPRPHRHKRSQTQFGLKTSLVHSPPTASSECWLTRRRPVGWTFSATPPSPSSPSHFLLQLTTASTLHKKSLLTHVAAPCLSTLQVYVFFFSVFSLVKLEETTARGERAAQSTTWLSWWPVVVKL